MACKAGANHGNRPKHAPPQRREEHLQEVWEYNLDEEILKMRDAAEEYQYVSMDMLFPGAIAEPTGLFEDYAQYNYQTLRTNIDITRVIVIGLTLSDAEGVPPEGVSTWRFHFQFDVHRDVIAQELVEGWRRSHGVDFEKHTLQGIDPHQFGELLMSSGLVLNDEIHWIAFCAAKAFAQRPMGGRLEELPWVSFCGLYTFAHFLHLVTSEDLPTEVKGFRESLDLFFPSRCDLADHLHQLPQLNGRDPADPQRRPFYCQGDHVHEAFFCLPSVVRSTAFDPIEEALASPEPARPKKRRSKKAWVDSDRVMQSSKPAWNDGIAIDCPPLNGIAKAGGS